MKMLKMLCAAFAAVMMTLSAQAAKTAKAVLENDGATLRFVYDESNYGTKDVAWFSVAEAEAIDPYDDNVPWYGKRSTVTKVVFDPSFAACRPKQCGSWFYDFGVLAAVEGLKNLNTSVSTNMAFMFYGCSSLTVLDVSGFDTANVTDMYGMFLGCSSLTTLDLASFDTANVTDMRYMFYGCSSLTTITISDSFVTTSVESSSRMFEDCTALKGGAGTAFDSTKTDASYARIDGGPSAPGYFTRAPTAKAVVADSGRTLKFVYDGKDYGTKDTDWFSVAEAEKIDPYNDNVPWLGKRSTVTKVVFDPSFAAYRPKQCGSWFFDFGVLAAVDGLKNLDTSVATSMAYMFSLCRALKSLDVTGFDTSNVTDMAYMFWDCSSLTTITISDSFVTTSVKSSSRMFEDCTALKGGAGTAFDSTKTDAAYARIDGGPSAPGYFTRALTAKAVVEDGGKTLRFVYDDTNYGTKGTDWFSVAEAEAIDPYDDNVPWYGKRSTVTKVVFDPSFAAYRPKQCGCWFYYFAVLAAVDGLTNLDTSVATNMAYMFCGCLSLTTLNLASFDTANVTSMHAMFGRCSSLTTLNLASFDTAKVTDMSSMFEDCLSLTTLNLASFDTSKVTGMAFMFYGCSSLEAICASDRFVTDQVSDSPSMFKNCSKLVGGAGTAYDSTKTDKTYARIDKAGQPGYFTPTAKAVVEDGGKTLRFVYDGKDYGTKDTDWFSVAEAEAIDPYNSDNVPWYGKWSTVTKVVFDPSFAAYRPKQCCFWFYNFRVLAAVDGLTNLDTSVATNMYFMFAICRELKSLDVSGFDTSKVTDMRSMFFFCSSLTTLNLASFDTAKVTDMDSMFAVCSSLKAICVSDRFVTDQVSDSSGMFQSCSKLIGGAGTAYDSTKTDKTYARIDKAGQPGYFTPTAKVVVEDGGKTLRFVYDGKDYGTKGTGWFSVAEAEAIDPYNEDVPWCDYDATVTNVVFDPSFAACRPKQCGSWFYDFGVLAAVEGLKNLNTSVTTNMAFMFYGCSSLTVLDVSGFDTANVTDMYGMFLGCSSLTTLDLASFDTANVTDMAYMFWDCSSLTTITISDSFVTTSVESSSRMFEDCAALKGGAGTAYDSAKTDKTYARIDGGSSAPGYFTRGAITGGYAAWAAEQGLTGADAAWDAKPDLWGGEWENAFIYTYGEGLAGGTLDIMNISFDVNGKPVITTTPVVEGHTDFTPAVIGTPNLQNWTSPVVLENRSGDDWTLPIGESANFFRVRLSE